MIDDKIFIYSVSSRFIADRLITVPKEFYTGLCEKFKPKDDDCKFVVTVNFDHLLGDSYKFYSFKIFDPSFSPIRELDGVYKLTKDEFKETWTTKWSSKILPLSFESDMFDKYELDISSIAGHLKTVQQIAFVLEAIDGRNTKLTTIETTEIRNKLDGYLNVKKI